MSRRRSRWQAMQRSMVGRIHERKLVRNVKCSCAHRQSWPSEHECLHCSRLVNECLAFSGFHFKVVGSMRGFSRSGPQTGTLAGKLTYVIQLIECHAVSQVRSSNSGLGAKRDPTFRSSLELTDTTKRLGHTALVGSKRDGR